MVQRTFYALPHEAPRDEPGWEPVTNDVHTLKHGYNMADLDRLARASLARSLGLSLGFRDRYELAWSVIAEHLYAAPADAPPAPGELIAAAQKAAGQAVYTEMHHRGHDANKPGGIMPRFAAFWECHLRTGGPEGPIVERLALWQIWDQLPDSHREALNALAMCEDHSAAAALLGKSPGAFAASIARARRAFLVLWHEGEKPSGHWGCDRRGAHRASARTALVRRERHRQGITSVRRRITVSQFADLRSRREAGATLAELADDLRFSKSYISRLLSGVLKPAPDMP